MRKFKQILSAIIVILLLINCNGKVETEIKEQQNTDLAANVKDDDSDAMNFQVVRGDFQWDKICNINSDYYYIWTYNIYYLDNASNTMTLLCDKINCNNIDGTDYKKAANSDCNAFFKGAYWIQESGGYLYTIAQDVDPVKKKLGYVLYKVKKDGSSRKRVAYLSELSPSISSIIYQGYCYYMLDNSIINDDYHYEALSLYRIALDGSSDSECIIPNENNENYSIRNLVGYNGLVYFIHGSQEERLLSYYENSSLISCQIKCYNPETGEVSTVFNPQKRCVTFIIKDNIFYYSTYEGGIQKYDPSNQTESTVVTDTSLAGSDILNDGNYLYLYAEDYTNPALTAKEYYNVYSYDGTFIDRIDAPMGAWNLNGDDKYLFYGTEYSVFRFDKSQIGKETHEWEQYEFH